MSAAYYPVFLDVRARPVLLVGGGHVAHEKIGRLVDSGADVTVVAPELIEAVRVYVEDGRARWWPRRFEAGDTAGFYLVMVATDDGAVNAGVAAEARSNGALVNAADDADNCDFILPSVVRRGTITLAASTAGTSPALARWLRERLEEFLTDEVVALGDLLADVRAAARERDRECASTCAEAGVPPPLLCKSCPNRIPADRWQDAIDEELRALLRAGEYDRARARLVHALGIDRPLARPAAAH